MSKEYKLKDIKLLDIVDICRKDIVGESKKDFKTKGLNKKLSLLGKEFFDVIYYKQDDKRLEKAISKLEKLMPKILKLKPNIDIHIDKDVAIVEKCERSGSLSGIKLLMSHAKENEKESMEFRKEYTKKQKEEAERQAQREKDAKDPDKIAAREEAAANRKDANDFIKSLRVNAVTRQQRANMDQAMQEYRDGASPYKTGATLVKETAEANKRLREAGLDNDER